MSDGRRCDHAGPGRSQRGYTAERLQLIPAPTLLNHMAHETNQRTDTTDTFTPQTTSTVGFPDKHLGGVN